MPASTPSFLNAQGSPCTPPARAGSASLTRLSTSLSTGSAHMHSVMHNVSYSAASASTATGRQCRTSHAGRERPHSAAVSGGKRTPAALQPALQP
eukprot:scaffold141377_cov118-Phaeocystis_antarctica.AAC.1